MRSVWFGAACFVTIAGSLAARADQTGAREQIFVCGEDHKLERPIPLTWGNVVLAGDGRLMVACPANWPHPPDHRERREARLIAEGLGEMLQGGVEGKPAAAQSSLPGDLRWRAVQAYIRAGEMVRSLLPMIVTWNTATGMAATTVSDPVGVLQPPQINVIKPACNPRTYVASDREGTRRWQPGRLFFLAMDKSLIIRKEAAYGIGVQLAAKDKPEESYVAAATEELRSCIAREADEGVSAVMLEALGATRYANAAQAEEAASYLVEQSKGGTTARRFGALKGLEALTRQNPSIAWDDAIKIRLRQLALFGPRAETSDPRIRRLALLAMRNARDFHVPTLGTAVMDSDFQVRRLVAMSLNLSDPEQAAMGASLANDPAFQVRYEYLVPLQRLATRTTSCAPMAKYFKDPSPAVIMRAMDLVPAACTDLEEILSIIDGHAEQLATNESFKQWHLPSRALSALARVNPARAKALLPEALVHHVWQVRAAAAAVTVTLASPAAAESLAKDPEPNVRTAALDALFRLKSPALYEAAIDALVTQSDYQLLRAAALNLREVPEDLKPRAVDALLRSLRKVTEEETDTSRDTREAILNRLGEILPPERSGDLVTYLSDYDDTIIGAAARAFEKLVTTSPGSPAKRRRYPQQPPEVVLYSPPSMARIVFEEGAVIIGFLPDVAPVTVARVQDLITQGYYNGKTFHRVVPNFVVQGGSPGKNEYAGVSRFMRDEVGPTWSHERGTIGISTRGMDTGDAQLFINLVDNPRLDRNYTVFAIVKDDGMDVIDKLLDGAVIRSISIIK